MPSRKRTVSSSVWRDGDRRKCTEEMKGTRTIVNSYRSGDFFQVSGQLGARRLQQLVEDIASLLGGMIHRVTNRACACVHERLRTG